MSRFESILLVDTGHLSSPSAESTSKSLLRRIRAHDHAAWPRLVRIYTPLVYRWCRRAGVSAEDSKDIAQEAFQAVSTDISRFRREKEGDSFRGWLFGITRNKISLHFRKLQDKPMAAGGTNAHELLQNAEQPPLDEECDDRSLVFHAALEQLREEFEEQTWQAFWKTAIENERAVDVAQALDMTPNAVRQAKFRILRRLREELDELDNV